MEITQSIQQVTCDQFHQAIKEKATNYSELAKIVVEIIENQTLFTFSEFLHLKEIEQVMDCKSASGHNQSILSIAAQSRRVRKILQRSESVRLRNFSPVSGEQGKDNCADAFHGEEAQTLDDSYIS